MPIKMGDKTYSEFEDASTAVQADKGLSEDRANAYVATIDDKQNKSGEQDAQEPEGLTTPSAGDQDEGVAKDLTSPTGSGREAENPNASGNGELGQTTSPQDQAEDPANPRDQAQPPNVGHQTTSEVDPDSEIKTNDEYGALNGDKYAKNEQDQKDEKRDEHQGLEYDGETYHKVKAIEFDDEIYVQKDDKDEASEDDLEYEDDIYKKADEETLELENDNDYYVKDNEQAPMDVTQTSPLEAPDLNPISGESVIIKENGKYRRYSVYEVDEDSVEKPAEVQNLPPVVQPQGNIGAPAEEPIVDPVEQKEPSEEIRAVEKIIIKEQGKLKFKSVFTEVKKKL